MFNAKWGPGFKYGHGMAQRPFDPARCKAQVSDRFYRCPSYSQCGKPPVEGCDGFCKTHANQYIRKPTGEKVYVVYCASWDDNGKPRLVEADVVRKSEKQVVIAYEEDGLAWDCRTCHKTENLHFTPEAAWESYRKAILAKIAGLESELVEQRRLLKLVKAAR